MADENFDLFISYAFEDRETVALPLTRALQERGLKVWFAGDQLQLGDSLNQSINAGLGKSRYGAVVFSKGYITNHRWTMTELNSLIASQTAQKEKVILPIWHEISYDELRSLLPIMADLVGISTDKGIPTIADAIHRAITNDPMTAGGGGASPGLSSAPKVTKDQVRTAIAMGEIEDAIEGLTLLAKGTRYENDVLGQAGRYNGNKRNMMQGMMMADAFQVQKTLIQQALLDLLDRI